jgi:glycerol-3-phosphate acyltransferase PlsY
VNIYLFIGAALLGYLIGSVSMARVIGRLLAPGVDFSSQDYQILGGDIISLDIASATNVSQKLGAKFGCLVSILDMLKVFFPTLFFRLAFPESPYFLAAAAMGVVGHNFPLYYRFRGGGGLSAAMGGLLVVDWLAVVVTPAAGMLLGMGLIRDAYVASTLWLFLLIPWLWIRTHDWTYIMYAAVITVSFLLATLPLTKQYLKLRRKGPEALVAFYEQFHMGRGLVKIGRFFGLYKKKS